MTRIAYALAAPLVAAAALAGFGGFGTGDDKKPADPNPPGSAEVKPAWKVGDSWVVETFADATQARTDKPQQTKPVQWQFTIEKQEKVGDVDAVKVKVECQLPGQQPQTALWLDQKRLSLVQMQTQFAVQGEKRTVTEKYTHGQLGAPVFVPVTAIPLDIPCFLEKGVKATKFAYTATQPLPPGIKNADAGGFEYEVTQATRPVTAAEMKKFTPLAKSFVKSIQDKPTVVFDMTAGSRQVTQVWQADLPWPVYSTNGRTEARLVKITRAP